MNPAIGEILKVRGGPKGYIGIYRNCGGTCKK